MLLRLFFPPFRPFILAVTALVTVAIWTPATANAAGFKVAQAGSVSPLRVPVALKCSRLGTQNGREILINTCASCRIVGIQRKRPGNDAPISRTVTIPSRARVTLSFRGPGQSRITTDIPCKASPGTQAAAPNPAQSDGRRCIQLARSANGLALANACGQCRAAVIERLDSRGGKRMQTVVIDAGKAIGLPAKGAAYARILTEKNCR